MIPGPVASRTGRAAARNIRSRILEVIPIGECVGRRYNQALSENTRTSRLSF